MIVGAPAAARRPPSAGGLALASIALLAVLLLLMWYPPAGTTLAPLAVATARLTAAMLAALGLPVVREAATLTHAGGFACEIDLACTALVPAALLVVAMAVLQARGRTVALGALLMVLANQLRLVMLVWIGVYAPHHLDVAHRVIGPVLLLAVAAGYLILCRRMARRH